MNFIEEFLKTHKDKTDHEIRVLGIDLGTTNSTVAEVIWKPGKSPTCKTLEIDQPTREGIYTSPIVPSVVANCFVSAKFGPLMIFLKRWFAYNKITQGDMHEYQEKTVA